MGPYISKIDVFCLIYCLPDKKVKLENNSTIGTNYVPKFDIMVIIINSNSYATNNNLAFKCLEKKNFLNRSVRRFINI